MLKTNSIGACLPPTVNNCTENTSAIIESSGLHIIGPRVSIGVVTRDGLPNQHRTRKKEQLPTMQTIIE